MMWPTECRICKKSISIEKYDDPICNACKDVDALVARAHAVIDAAFSAGAEVMVPMFSGGHDSYTACKIASLHPQFDGRVYHIRTGIGSAATFEFVNEVCREEKWELQTFKSKSTYEMFVRERGFPGPGMHRWAYVRLKERCVRMMCGMHTKERVTKAGKNKSRIRNVKRNVALITGCREQESERRMGTIKPFVIGEEQKNGKILNKYRYWVSPCHNWTTANQRAFMDAYDLPGNPVKMTPIGMSGECFCGAFAKPGELEMIRLYVPDVAAEIDRLTVIALENGKHSVWGTRPDRKKGVCVLKTGPLCNSCDARAAVAGLIIDQGSLF